MNHINDENGQISAEMILLLGAIMVIVIIAGIYVFGISKSVSGNVTAVTNTARNSAINRM